MSEHVRNLPYDPTKFKRETLPYYISMTDSEIAEILKILGLHSLDELFNHLPNNIKFQNDFNLGKALSYNDLIEYVTNIANKNKIMTSYIGDGLKNYKVEKIVDDVCSIRGLTTAYTPYQPERGQERLQRGPPGASFLRVPRKRPGAGKYHRAGGDLLPD